MARKQAPLAVAQPPRHDPQDPDAHWAIPALARLLLSPPPNSGGVGDSDDYRALPPRFRDTRIPPAPGDMRDQDAVRKWLDHCSALRMHGSGN